MPPPSGSSGARSLVSSNHDQHPLSVDSRTSPLPRSGTPRATAGPSDTSSSAVRSNTPSIRLSSSTVVAEDLDVEFSCPLCSLIVCRDTFYAHYLWEKERKAKNLHNVAVPKTLDGYWHETTPLPAAPSLSSSSQPLSESRSDTKKRRSNLTGVYVSNMATRVNTVAVRARFQHCGPIAEVQWAKSNVGAYVFFGSEDVARRALALDGTSWEGLQSRVEPVYTSDDELSRHRTKIAKRSAPTARSSAPHRQPHQSPTTAGQPPPPPRGPPRSAGGGHYVIGDRRGWRR